MAKLRDVAKGTLAVKPVTLRLANAVAQPGQTPSDEPTEFKLGLRVLTGDETIEVYEKAAAAAKAKGIAEWDEEHPICALYVMVNRLALAGVDVDEASGLPPDPGKLTPCFASADEILASALIGTENIVWLNSQWVEWQDEHSPLTTKFSFEQAVGMMLQDLDRKDGDPGPLASLPRATLVSFTRTMGALWLSSLKLRSPSGTPATFDSLSMKKSGETSEPS